MNRWGLKHQQNAYNKITSNWINTLANHPQSPLSHTHTPLHPWVHHICYYEIFIDIVHTFVTNFVVAIIEN